MIVIRFKNLKKSDLLKQNVEDRFSSIVEKFPDLIESQIKVTLEMLNSPYQAGPDLYSVRVYINGGRYNQIKMEKNNSNIRLALAEIIDDFLEVLNRYGDKQRVKERSLARKKLSQLMTVQNMNFKKIS